MAPSRENVGSGDYFWDMRHDPPPNPYRGPAPMPQSVPPGRRVGIMTPGVTGTPPGWEPIPGHPGYMQEIAPANAPSGDMPPGGGGVLTGPGGGGDMPPGGGEVTPGPGGSAAPGGGGEVLQWRAPASPGVPPGPSPYEIPSAPMGGGYDAPAPAPGVSPYEIQRGTWSSYVPPAEEPAAASNVDENWDGLGWAVSGVREKTMPDQYGNWTGEDWQNYLMGGGQIVGQGAQIVGADGSMSGAPAGYRMPGLPPPAGAPPSVGPGYAPPGAPPGVTIIPVGNQPMLLQGCQMGRQVILAGATAIFQTNVQKGRFRPIRFIAEYNGALAGDLVVLEIKIGAELELVGSGSGFPIGAFSPNSFDTKLACHTAGTSQTISFTVQNLGGTTANVTVGVLGNSQ